MGVECVDRLLGGGTQCSVEEAWASGLRNAWEVEEYLFEEHWAHSEEGSGKLNLWALTDQQREKLRAHAKRIWDVMEPLVRGRSAAGGPGIYCVLVSYRVVGWIEADSRDQASALAATLYGWLEAVHGRLSVELWYDPDAERCAELVRGLGERAAVNLKDARTQRDRYQKDIELWDAVTALISTGSV